jgi:glycerophosphoryl diester phosphodiesterase
MTWLWRVLGGLAILLVGMTLFNASWLAPTPRGTLRLIGNRGVSQLFDHGGVTNDTCTARRIEPPVHDRLENTERSMLDARRLGASMVQVHLVSTADGKLALFHDWTLDCRTNGRGPTRSATLAQLQALDPGYGYTADGGRTFPLRGLPGERIPSLEQGLAALPATSILFTFKSRDPAEADRLVAALKAADRDVAQRGDAFTGDPALLARIHAAFPDAWTYSKEGVKACTIGYLKTGWLGIVPAACRNGTMMIPIDRGWAFAGWPNRLLARLAKVGGRVILVGPQGSPRLGMGLTLPEQLGQVPASFKGFVLVDDIWTVGPSLHPGRDFRTQAQIDAANAGLERRRERAD